MGLQKDLATRMEAAGASVDLQSAATALVEWAVAPVIDELMKQHQEMKTKLANTQRKKRQPSCFSQTP